LGRLRCGLAASCGGPHRWNGHWFDTGAYVNSGTFPDICSQIGGNICRLLDEYGVHGADACPPLSRYNYRQYFTKLIEPIRLQVKQISEIFKASQRKHGLLKEMQLVANNIANTSTTGYRREGTVFSEFIKQVPTEGASISMTDSHVRMTDTAPGVNSQTGGTFDLAIQGDGFFMIETAGGPRLTRAGALVSLPTSMVSCC